MFNCVYGLLRLYNTLGHMENNYLLYSFTSCRYIIKQNISEEKKSRAFNLISVKLTFETSQLLCPCDYNTYYMEKSALERKTGKLFF